MSSCKFVGGGGRAQRMMATTMSMMTNSKLIESIDWTFACLLFLGGGGGGCDGDELYDPTLANFAFAYLFFSGGGERTHCLLALFVRRLITHAFGDGALGGGVRQ